MAELTLYPDSPDSDDGDVSKAAFDAAKMVIDKTSIDSNKAWQTAYKNVVMAVGRRYKKYGQRENGIEEGEGASERTKYQELVQKITVANTIGNVVNVVMDKAGETFNRLLP